MSQTRTEELTMATVTANYHPVGTRSTASEGSFMESLVSLHAFIGTMNQFEKLRRSGMYVRRFMDCSNVPGTRIAPMNRPDLLLLRCLGRLVRVWKIGPGETKPIWNLVL